MNTMLSTAEESIYPEFSVGDFRSALAHLAAAVNVIATDGPAGRTGFTATAVCSVCDTPPTVLVCMRSGARSNPAFITNGVLSINVLAAGQEHLSRRFSDPGISREERFATASWKTRNSGAPLLDDSVVSLDCRIDHIHRVGTHDVFFCRVLGVYTHEAAEALAYFDHTYHHLGEHSKYH